MRRHSVRTLIAAASMIAASALPLTILGSGNSAHAATLSKDVTANLFMWNWNSVASECANVLGPDGYAAVQVAPPQDSLDRSGHPWWEIYQPVDDNLTSRMGNETQFRAMVTACHNAGVKVYVDAVLNHMAAQPSTNGTSYGGASYTPGVSYPAYSSGDFHTYPADCPNSSDQIVNWNNYTEVTKCQLVGLPDLRTESAYVRSQLAGYLNKLIGYGVDGFRLDAAKHIGESDLAAIESQLSKPVYITQEVTPGGTGALAPASFEPEGSLLGFDYADALKAQFQGSIANFRTFNTWTLLPSAYSSSFVTNHDTERNGSTLDYKNGATYTLATEFLLAFGYGTPQVYSSFDWTNSDDSPPSDANGYVTNTTCGSGWECTDRLTGVANMVAWHNLALTNNDPVAHWYDDGSNLIAFSRGPDAWITLNNETTAQTHTFATGLPDGTYCDLIHGSIAEGGCTGPTVTVTGGATTTTVRAGDAIAIDANSKVTGASSASASPSASASSSASASPSPSNSAATGVTEAFTVTGAPSTAPIYLVGSIPALGNWAPASAIAMTKTGSSGPPPSPAWPPGTPPTP